MSRFRANTSIPEKVAKRKKSRTLSNFLLEFQSTLFNKKKKAEGSMDSNADITIEQSPLLNDSFSDRDTRSVHGVSSKKITVWEAATAVFKGNLGAGVLSLPYAFMHSGFWGGIVGLPLIYIVSMHCCKLLLDTKMKVKSVLHKSNISYAELGGLTFGKFGSWLIDALLIFTQTGFGCAYVIFVVNNMLDMVPVKWMTEPLWALCCLPILIGLCLLRSLKYVAPFTLLANFTLVGGIGVVYRYTIPELHPISEVKAFDPVTFPVFFGTAVFCFEGIGLVLPIENAMKKPHHFLATLYSVMGGISVLLITFGATGYLAFESNTQSIITSNLPQGITSTIVRGALCFSLLMTFPVQLYPVTEILETRLGLLQSEPVPWRETKRNILRIVTVIFATLIAIAIPHFGLFIGLIGSMGSSALAFVMPALFHIKVFGTQLPKWVKAKDVLIVLFGLVGGITGTVITVADIIEAFKE